jgi:hypothetical protein
VITRASLFLLFTCACAGSARQPEHTSSVVALRSEAVAHGHVLVIENPTARAIRVHRQIVVEREENGTWHDIDVGLLYVRKQCNTETGAIFEPAECVEIAAHSTFRVAQWDDMIGDAQCECEECGPVSTGRYRFVLTTCDAPDRYESAPFDVAGR